MRRSTLVLLGSLGLFSPLVLQPLAQSLAIAIVLLSLLVAVIVTLAVFNQAINNRLIKLITAILLNGKQKSLTKKN